MTVHIVCVCACGLVGACVCLCNADSSVSLCVFSCTAEMAAVLRFIDILAQYLII